MRCVASLPPRYHLGVGKGISLLPCHPLRRLSPNVANVAGAARCLSPPQFLPTTSPPAPLGCRERPKFCTSFLGPALGVTSVPDGVAPLFSHRFSPSRFQHHSSGPPPCQGLGRRRRRWCVVERQSLFVSPPARLKGRSRCLPARYRNYRRRRSSITSIVSLPSQISRTRVQFPVAHGIRSIGLANALGLGVWG